MFILLKCLALLLMNVLLNGKLMNIFVSKRCNVCYSSFMLQALSQKGVRIYCSTIIMYNLLYNSKTRPFSDIMFNFTSIGYCFTKDATISLFVIVSYKNCRYLYHIYTLLARQCYAKVKTQTFTVDQWTALVMATRNVTTERTLYHFYHFICR